MLQASKNREEERGRSERTVRCPMTTKLIVIAIVAVATVVGIFILGKLADKGEAEESAEKRK